MDLWHCSGKALIAQIDSCHEGLCMWYIGQCGFVFRYRGKTLLIDPVLNDMTTPSGVSRRHYAPPFAPMDIAVDWVLCTHAHADHMAVGTVPFLSAPIVLPAGCTEKAKELGVCAGRLHPMLPGQTMQLDDGITVTAISAAHPVHIDDPSDSTMAMGYEIRFGDFRVVHLGDTYLTDRLLETLCAMEPPHLFLPPINGDDRFRAQRNCIGNMEAEEAAKLAVHIGARLTIPTHYDMVQDNTVDPLRFAAELRRLSPAACWKIPALGEKMILTSGEFEKTLF